MEGLTKCKSCGADIFWIKYQGKQHPTNAKPKKVFIVENVDGKTKWTFRGGYESHFATCPQAKDWRKDEKI